MSRDSRFTPGPWQTHVGWDVTGYPCFFIHGFSGDQKRDIPMLQANANLIASAPELYEALRELVTACEDGWICPDASKVRPDHELLSYEAGFEEAQRFFAKSSMVQKAKAALSKAEGKGDEHE